MDKINNCFIELKQRGYLYQSTDLKLLENIFNKEKIVFYVGFDLTASSLHIGHLLLLFLSELLLKYGHKMIILLGGATTLIGDPTGRDKMRVFLKKSQIKSNTNDIKKQLIEVINNITKTHKNDIMHNHIIKIVNNNEWYSEYKHIDFLRDIGIYFNIKHMMTMESVKSRIGHGITLLEFNYMALQAYDFLLLNKKYNCVLQIGGQDQWGNIIFGIDLIRKKQHKNVYGITAPLLLDSIGNKFGKTADNNKTIWLNENHTSIFDFYQFWRNIDDKDIIKFFKLFTTLSIDKIEKYNIKIQLLSNSKLIFYLNKLKKELAYEITKAVHGIAKADIIHSITDNIFKNNKFVDITAPKIIISIKILEKYFLYILLKNIKICTSNGEARRLISGGGISINNKKILDYNYYFYFKNMCKEELILKIGKNTIKYIILDVII